MCEIVKDQQYMQINASFLKVEAEGLGVQVLAT